MAVFHRICPANPEAITLFMAVMRNFLTKAHKMTTQDIEVNNTRVEIRNNN